jgi:predicted Zn finger-like uncharacterized protein
MTEPNQKSDTVVDRASTVRSSLAREGDPRTVQAAVDGRCPNCGSRFVVTVRGDLGSVTCPDCDQTFSV